MHTLRQLLLLFLAARGFDMELGERTPDTVDATCMLQVAQQLIVGPGSSGTPSAVNSIGQAVAASDKVVRSQNAISIDKSTSSAVNNKAFTVPGVDTTSTISSFMDLGSAVDAAEEIEREEETDMHRRSVTNVLCVGDSITLGESPTPYPDQLQTLLGSQWNVTGIGSSGASAQECHYHRSDCDLGIEGTHHSFWDSWKLNASLAVAAFADIVVIMFGTNDGWDCHNLDTCEFDYRRDYIRLIAKYQSLPSHPWMFVAVPPPVYLYNNKGGTNQTFVNERLPLAIPDIAKNRSLTLPIDVFSSFTSICPLINNTNSFNCTLMRHDGVHPDDAGNGVIARAVFNRLTSWPHS